MRAGTLRHAGSIEEYTQTVDGFGGVTKVWTEFSKVWCAINPLRGTEKYVSAEKHATATHQVTIRYLDGVEPKMRLLSRGREFEVISVINVGERDKMMQLIVEEDADHDN